MAARDRDEQGRARNARPRDALGRPLPHGAEGVARIPDDLVLTPVAALREAQRLLDRGLPFHAHEVLEGAWKHAEPAQRELWQGLAQLAVGLTHVRRGNRSGAVTLIARARRRVAAAPAHAPHGIDTSGLLAWCDTAAVVLADPTADQSTIPPPRLVRTVDEEGGEPVCWLAQVCPSCGGLDPHTGDVCPRCGTPLDR